MTQETPMAKPRASKQEVLCACDGACAIEAENKKLRAGLDEAVAWIRARLPHAGADIVAKLGKL